MIHGENLTLSLNGTIVAAAKSCTLEFSQELIEVASPISGADKQYIPGKRGWTVSTDGMCETMGYVGKLQAGLSQKYTLRFYDKDLSIYHSGSCYIKSLRVSGEIGKIVTYSVSLQGSGAMGDTSETLTSDLALTDTYINPLSMSYTVFQAEQDQSAKTWYIQVTIKSKNDILVITTSGSELKFCLFVDEETFEKFVNLEIIMCSRLFRQGETRRLSNINPGIYYILFDGKSENGTPASIDASVSAKIYYS